jgi:hypothetical protein
MSLKAQLIQRGEAEESSGYGRIKQRHLNRTGTIRSS